MRLNGNTLETQVADQRFHDPRAMSSSCRAARITVDNGGIQMALLRRAAQKPVARNRPATMA